MVFHGLGMMLGLGCFKGFRTDKILDRRQKVCIYLGMVLGLGTHRKAVLLNLMRIYSYHQFIKVGVTKFLLHPL